MTAKKSKSLKEMSIDIKENNKTGVFLLAISERGYENEIEEFFNNLKENYSKLIETVGNTTLPDFQIK